MSANNVFSAEALTKQFMQSVQPMMLKMMEEFLTKSAPQATEQSKATEVGVNGTHSTEPSQQQVYAGSMEKPASPIAAAEPSRYSPVEQVSSNSSSSDERIRIKNDTDFENLRTDSKGFNYRRVRPPRTVTRPHEGITDVATLEKLRALGSWERVDLPCSSSQHETQPCKATQVIDRNKDTHEILAVHLRGEHRKDHPVQKRRRADVDVLRMAKDLMQAGKTPAQIEEELEELARLDAGPGASLKASRAPGKAVLSRMSTYERSKANPHAASEVLQNVQARFGPDLLIGTTIPSVRFIYMREWQREYARSRQVKVISLDCTFRCIVGDLLLTVVLCQAPAPYYRVWFPLAFCIHEKESEEDLSSLLHEIQKKAPMKPEMVLGDFSYAIQNAVRKELPNATYYGDVFHLFHTNHNWLRSNGIDKENCKAIIKDLRSLVLSRTYQEFNSRHNAFKEKWRVSHSQYVDYFARTWEGRAEQWCLVSRPTDAPTGDQIHEAYHRRLKKHVFRGRLKIDLLTILTMLHKESEHWRNTVLSTERLAELSREVNQRANTRAEPLREPRIHTLANRDTVVVLTADSDEEDEDPAAEDFALLNEQEAVPPPATAELPEPVRSLLRLNVCPGVDGIRCEAKKKQPSQRCPKKLCSKCCARTLGECAVSAHNKARFKRALGPLIAKLDQAVDRGLTSPNKELWISYKKLDSDYSRVHMIHDVRWDEDDKKHFHAKLFSKTEQNEVDCQFKVGRLYDVSWTQIN